MQQHTVHRRGQYDKDIRDRFFYSSTRERNTERWGAVLLLEDENFTVHTAFFRTMTQGNYLFIKIIIHFDGQWSRNLTLHFQEVTKFTLWFAKLDQTLTVVYKQRGKAVDCKRETLVVVVLGSFFLFFNCSGYRLASIFVWLHSLKITPYPLLQSLPCREKITTWSWGSNPFAPIDLLW